MTKVEKLKKQILAVRDSGKVNMLDTRGVQWVANSMGFYDLVTFIEFDRHGYASFIMSGNDMYLS